MKKINFFIHPGYPKTGTTFLQEKVFNNKNLVSLGRPHLENTNSKEIISLQYKILQSKINFNSNLPINYSYKIKEYVNELCQIINNSEIQNFILSDECIFDCENHFGYVNIYLLKEIIDLLSNYFQLNLKFILTIRNQRDLLASWYAYDNYRKKKNFNSLDDYIKNMTEDKNLSEIYNFDIIYLKIKKIFKCEVLVLPLEELENFPNNYLSKIEKYLNIKVNNSILNKVNQNSKNIDNQKFYYIRTLDFRKIYLPFLENLHQELKRNIFYKKYFKNLRFFKKIIMPEPIKKQLIKLNNEQMNQIKECFKNSNQRLEKQTNIDLKKFNYY